MKDAVLLFLVMWFSTLTFGQATYEDEKNVPKTDPPVLKKLACVLQK